MACCGRLPFAEKMLFFPPVGFKGNLSLLEIFIIEITRSADASGVQGNLRPFSFFHGSDAEDAGNARDATTRTGTDPIFTSKISRLSDTQG